MIDHISKRIVLNDPSPYLATKAEMNAFYLRLQKCWEEIMRLKNKGTEII